MFVAELDALTAVYQAAMQPDPIQLPGRRSIMERHASYSGFRALAVTEDALTGSGQPGSGQPGSGQPGSGQPGLEQAGGERGTPGGWRRFGGWGRSSGQAPSATPGPAGPGPPGQPSPGTAGPGTAGPGTAGPARTPGQTGAPGRIIGFTYGFRGADGQWWHDVVVAALTARSGAELALAWLSDSLEIAEVHVHPDYHRRGIGRSLVLGLAAGRVERTAVLSTQDANATARRLYSRLGFGDLMTGYSFPGSAVPYAVMGAVLPLRVPPAPTPPRPSNS
jgi:GNAT superfamily N-acetyltransferase